MAQLKRGKKTNKVAIKAFHCGIVKRRGDPFPARLRFPARRGVTLVELMIAMLILAIVCVAWLEIIGIQSAKKEARRREAVERLAGMMDAFMYVKRGSATKKIDIGYYSWDRRAEAFTWKGNVGDVHSVFDNETEVSSVGYRLHVVEVDGLPNGALFGGWDIVYAKKSKGVSLWLVGELFNQYGKESEVGKAYFKLPVCLGSSAVTK